MIDATCPLVTKVHVEAVKFAKEGYSLILIGHKDHDEVIGTLGEAPLVTQVVGSPEQVASLHVPDPNRVAYLTQTTLSLDETKDIIAALKQKFPNIKGPAAQDICYATENRQVAVKQVASEADLLLVVGSENSSNSNRLVEVARNLGTNAHLIDSCNDIEPDWLKGVKTIALTAGASAPEHLVEETVTFLRGKGFRQCAGTGSDAGERALRAAAGDRGSDRGRSGAPRIERRIASVRPANFAVTSLTCTIGPDRRSDRSR